MQLERKESPEQVQQKQVLIVEDDPLIQMGLERILSMMPEICVVGSATDGWTAIAKAVDLQPQVVLMDIGLPKLDGIEATRQIKELMPDIGIVVFSSVHEREKVIKALNCGASAYCLKSNQNIEHLRAAIAAADAGALYLAPQISEQLLLERLTPPPHLKQVNLSQREQQVLELVVQGKINEQIAQELSVSCNTVKTYLKGLMDKLVANSRTSLVVRAFQLKLVSLPDFED